MSRRWLAPLLLALALLIGQLGGFAHVLSHLGQADEGDRPHAACELCVAYSAFDHGAPGTPVVPTAEADAFIPLTLARPAWAEAGARAYLSRAPPPV